MRWWTPLVFIAAAASAAPVELQEQIHIARAGILPKTVFIFVVGRNFSDGSEQRQIWGGSGVIISTDGYVASNSHVLSHSSRVRAMLSDGTSYEGRVIGTDEETDLGLLQLTRTGDQAPLPAVEFADSSPVAGDFVLAIGSPHFLTRSVTFGIVNNPRQSLYENDLYNWVQTDALINPGNSGGPLINLAGKLVGINTRGGDGMGFAIPSTVVREITERLRRDGRVERSMLGLTLQARNDFRHETYVDAAQGALIIGVESNSPAAAAGFQVGDLLLAAGGQAIDAPYPEDMATTRRLLADLKPGVATRFMLLRSGKTLS
jgi:serine protease Do